MRQFRHLRPKVSLNKTSFFIIGSSLVTAIIFIRLFQLQIMAHAHYQEVATREQHGYLKLPAQRGEIIIKDSHSEEEFALATNTTLNLLFADPAIIKDPLYIRDKVAPLIFDIEEERATDNERLQKLSRNLPAETTEEEKAKILTPLSDEELKNKFNQEFLTKISERQRPKIILANNLEPAKINEIKALGLGGVEIIDDDVNVYPPQLSSTTLAAEKLAPIVEIPQKKLASILKGENRYVILKKKLDPEISKEIEKMIAEDPADMMTGLGMKEEYFRFYPEGSLAANIVGYVNNENLGQYGIESTFNTQLMGVAGELQTKKDSIGRQITVGESTLQAAVDGSDIVLTIDRSVQLTLEKILEEDTKAFRADSGQAIIMNPKTGAIIAMAHYPTFDPNVYGDVFKKVEVSLTPDEIKNLFPTKDEGVYQFYTNAVTLDFYLVFEQRDENDNTHYYRYDNLRGPEVYHNKIVSWPYEPGSVFKPIAMSAAIDDGDVTPNTTFNDAGPIGVDFNKYSQEFDFEIKNSTNKYWGLIDMKTVLAKSLNTGMTFVAKKMGPALFYSYLKKYGFLDRTDIEFDSEITGKIEYYDGTTEFWTESELATHAFGQGLTVTMVQLASAYCAIANGGVLMQPYVIDEIRQDNGIITKTEPREVRRVISEETSEKIKSMLIYVIENGEGKKGSVPGHYVGGKTGTSQTYKHGRALSGVGTTLGTFAGYGPIDDPQFVVLIKYDHPRSSEWGSSTAAETFSKLGTYLFEYYNIAPDKE
ncbi:MAG: penicillin-binding protein 2 [Patescibacteria group bacterium]